MSKTCIRFLASFSLLVTVGLPAAGHARRCENDSYLSHRLAATVRNFDNHGQPVIPTLLAVSAQYRLPMGIEQVTREALEHPVSVTLREGTVAALLRLCLSKAAGYAWRTDGGSVLIYGPKELARRSNFLNARISSFSVRDATLGDANLRLRMAVEDIDARRKAAESGVPMQGGIAGDTPFSTDMENERLTLMANYWKVRQILDRLVALHGGAVWIALSYPDQLSVLPGDGLWEFLSMGEDRAKGVLGIAEKHSEVAKHETSQDY